MEYVLKNHEKTLFSRSFHYDSEAAKNDDSKLVFEKKWTGKEAVRIDKKKANYNSLTFQVNALDHAGNRSTAAYKFGIDITPPVVTLTYDNNHDRNGFYFNQSRTAVIAVKERSQAGHTEAGPKAREHLRKAAGISSPGNLITEMMTLISGRSLFTMTESILCRWALSVKTMSLLITPGIREY